MAFQYLKALHLIFMVTWFAGLFYVVRLFIYQTEAQDKEEPEKGILTAQFKTMAKRLWYGITWPSLILISLFAGWMLWEQPSFLAMSFMHLKLAFVLGLYFYHFSCHRIFIKLQRDEYPYSSLKLRVWNEVATLFLVAIVFIIVLRDTISMIWGLVGLLAIATMLWSAIHFYRRKRRG
jgi:putative membrane protein